MKKGELVSDVGRASVDRPPGTYISPFCLNTRCHEWLLIRTDGQRETRKFVLSVWLDNYNDDDDIRGEAEK